MGISSRILFLTPSSNSTVQMLDVVLLHCQMPLCWSSTLPLNIPSHRAGPLGVAFVGGLLLCPRCLQCEHACMVPRELCSLARCRRRTTPTQLPWELRSWSCYSVHAVYNVSTRAWSLGSCARSLPSYNTSTAPLGVAFVVLLQRPDGVFDVVSHACTCVKGDALSVRRER